MDPGADGLGAGELNAFLQAFQERLGALEHAAHAAAANAAAAAANAPAAHAAGRAAPRPSKPPKPDTFSGRTDANAIRAWVAQVNNYFTAVHEPADSRLSYGVALLRDNALLWWQSLAEAERPATWETLADQLVRYFAPLSATIVARDALAKLQQRSSVKAYTNEFKRLLLNIPDMSENEKLDRYRRGLKTQVRLHVVFANPETFEQTCLLAEQIDSIIYMHRPTNPNPGANRVYDPFAASTSTAVPMEIGAVGQPGAPPAPPAPPSYADVVGGRTAPKFPKLTPEEKSRLMKENGCFYCRQAGHRAAQCPVKKGKAPARK